MSLRGLLFVAAVLSLATGMFGGRVATWVRLRPAPVWVRLSSTLVGVIAFISVTSGSGSQSESYPVYRNFAPSSSPDRVTLHALEARSTHKGPLHVGDQLTIYFSLTNDSGVVLPVEETFIGARNPARENRDFSHKDHRSFGPAHTFEVSGTLRLDREGIWRIWPCYWLNASPQPRYCPDYWNVFQVEVRP